MEKPLIFDFAQNRISETSPPFEYDDQQNLNVVDFRGSKVPFIEMPKYSQEHAILPEMFTKTFVNREEDEGEDEEENDQQSSDLFFDTQLTNRVSHYNLLELVTKTDVIREEDDDLDDEPPEGDPENRACYQNVIELLTKTKIDREEDDDDEEETSQLSASPKLARQDYSINLVELLTKTEVDREEDDDDSVYYE